MGIKVDFGDFCSISDEDVEFREGFEGEESLNFEGEESLDFLDLDPPGNRITL